MKPLIPSFSSSEIFLCLHWIEKSGRSLVCQRNGVRLEILTRYISYQFLSCLGELYNLVPGHVKLGHFKRRTLR